MKRLPFSLACFILFAAALAGCDPGAIDATMLNRYQAEMANRSPQPRRAESGGGLLEPTGALTPRLDIDLDANEVASVKLTLNDAVMRAMANNLDIRIVSFDPQIAREDMIKAAAAFDLVAFGGYSFARQHTHTINPGTTPEQVETQTAQAGVKQLIPTGGTWALSHSLRRMWDNGRFSTLPLNYQPMMSLEVTQPLLRDAWPAYNLAKLKVAQTNRRVSEADFRTTLEETIAKVVAAYWTLWQARREVPIRTDLLQYTQEIFRRVSDRAAIDADQSKIKQAESAVKDAQVQLERAQKTLADAQDSLLKLLADPQLNLTTNLEIVTVTDPAQMPVTIDLREQLLTGLEHNPQLAKARLSIELAEIGVQVAQNQALPRLDFKGNGSYQGLDRYYPESMAEMSDMRNFSFGASLNMEYPLGNRERLADLARTRLERLKSITQMQNLADQLAQNVRERVREIARSYREIQLVRELVTAKEAELQALTDVEQIRGPLTPEFLQLKLNTRNQLAEARSAELRAVQNYNIAMAGLAQVTGTVLKSYSVDIALPFIVGDSDWATSSRRPAPATGKSAD